MCGWRPSFYALAAEGPDRMVVVVVDDRTEEMEATSGGSAQGKGRGGGGHWAAGSMRLGIWRLWEGGGGCGKNEDILLWER